MKYRIPLFSRASSLAMVGFLKLSKKVVEPTIFTLFYSKCCSFFKISSRLKAYLEAPGPCLFGGNTQSPCLILQSQSHPLKFRVVNPSEFLLFISICRSFSYSYIYYSIVIVSCFLLILGITNFVGCATSLF